MKPFEKFKIIVPVWAVNYIKNRVTDNLSQQDLNHIRNFLYQLGQMYKGGYDINITFEDKPHFSCYNCLDAPAGMCVDAYVIVSRK